MEPIDFSFKETEHELYFGIWYQWWTQDARIVLGRKMSDFDVEIYEEDVDKVCDVFRIHGLNCDKQTGHYCEGLKVHVPSILLYAIDGTKIHLDDIVKILAPIKYHPALDDLAQGG